MSYSIDDVARAGMTSARGVRWWEEQGLLTDVPRSEKGQRRFTADHIRQARIIAAGQYASFSLEQIKQMLASYDGEAFEALQHKLATVAATALALGEGLPKPVVALEYDL
jgi:DNA-binding transcriptional MerR regulator